MISPTVQYLYLHTSHPIQCSIVAIPFPLHPHQYSMKSLISCGSITIDQALSRLSFHGVNVVVLLQDLFHLRGGGNAWHGWMEMNGHGLKWNAWMDWNLIDHTILNSCAQFPECTR